MLGQLEFQNPKHSIPSGLVFIPKQTARRLIYEAFKVAGMSPCFPLETRAVFALCRVAGYDASKDALDYLFRANKLPAPPKNGNAFAWDESSVIAFIDQLERMRKWIPGHDAHAHKFTDAERRQHAQSEAARDAAVKMFVAMPTDQVIGVMVDSDSREERLLAGIALRLQIGCTENTTGTDEPGPPPASLN